jgi:hypothetical protein
MLGDVHDEGGKDSLMRGMALTLSSLSNLVDAGMADPGSLSSGVALSVMCSTCATGSTTM